ncbi:ribonuclease J [Helicobacter cetorum]|uniref:Ribonuclease J n=1 Tax=Helicobacter cetorum (strain ATCC BAA-429 / MIT 00-7128) TaxID=182217 RepID=I0EL33_HELC0|nr:ribonuclease J [Helicobacter cetorum]AFI03652.1 ATP/GTP binding protein [Helicobacter cetorum MIT 00-7128]
MQENNEHNNYENNEHSYNHNQPNSNHNEPRVGAFNRFANRKKRFKENAQNKDENNHNQKPHKKEHANNHNKKERSNNPNHNKPKNAPQKTRNYAKEELDKNKVEGVTEILHVNERGTLGFHKELKKGVEANNKIQVEHLNPHYKMNLNSKASVKITPLGGLGEIGGNMMVIETPKSAIVIDVGMSFPKEGLFGVDILIPDFSYLHQIKDKIAGIIITHAHEDHIGATPYLFKELQFPLYGTPLSLGLIGSKFDEHGLKKYRSYFKIIEKRCPISIGEFIIEWIHITHSIIDSSALAIQTKAGTIIHTGDFKIDHTPVDNLPTDLYRLAHYGERGVMLLLSDSTNSHKAGTTPSESTIAPTFDALFKEAQGRVIMSTFSSNIHRVYQAIQYGIKYNRKIAVIGRSMEKNLDIARELGYIHLPYQSFIEANEVAQYPDNEVLIVTTGSQGETMSALYRMATDEHRHISIKPSDLIIISAKAIPGNEASVSAVLNFLMKKEAKVAYQEFNNIHVSGHAAQEEQKLMLRLIKPKFFLPVHGEYNHVARHKQTAIACGVPEKNIYLMEDGDQVEVSPNFIRKVGTIKSGKSYIDNQSSLSIDTNIVQQREEVASVGAFFATLFINKNKQALLESSQFSSLGLVSFKDEKNLTKEIQGGLEMLLKSSNAEIFSHPKKLEDCVRNFIRKSLFKKFRKYPAIICHVHAS